MTLLEEERKRTQRRNKEREVVEEGRKLTKVLGWDSARRRKKKNPKGEDNCPHHSPM